jgi:hypothetical protein
MFGPGRPEISSSFDQRYRRRLSREGHPHKPTSRPQVVNQRYWNDVSREEAPPPLTVPLVDHVAGYQPGDVHLDEPWLSIVWDRDYRCVYAKLTVSMEVVLLISRPPEPTESFLGKEKLGPFLQSNTV